MELHAVAYFRGKTLRVAIVERQDGDTEDEWWARAEQLEVELFRLHPWTYTILPGSKQVELDTKSNNVLNIFRVAGRE